MKANQRYLLIFCLLVLTSNSYAQQKIGLVLSGGGATGLSHIGVLKALEENEIPIDYVTGTSAGALVAGMYACGYSPSEIEAYVLAEEFQIMAAGGIRPDQHFLFREENPHAGMISLSISKDSLLRKSLPTNFNSSSYLDFEMLARLGTVGASRYNDFDSLFVPFRCVASDIQSKSSVVFGDGNLNEAVRASMTYPFFIKPLKVNGRLLFDGGLYNNFPADVMYMDFNPDYIIGSNVSYNADPPSEDNLISQLTNMLVTPSNFSLPCEEGFIIKPETEVSTFSFADAEQAIKDGYISTLKVIDSLKQQIKRSVSQEELKKRRQAFRKKIAPLVATSISTRKQNSDAKEIRYTRLSMIKARKPEHLSMDELEKRYFRLYATSQVDFIFPTVSLKEDSSYNVELAVRKAKEIRIDVGGHFSSRPVNTGYIGLSYQTIGSVLTKTHVESYFGKFYGSVKADFTLEFPAVYPISTRAYFVMNRWDYFRSFATFFEDVHPSFLVQNEMYTGIQMTQPFGNTVKSTVDLRLFALDDEYYQTENFTAQDTADVTYFQGFSGSWRFTKNSLNRKQFATSGHMLEFKARYVYGIENSVPGTTSFQNFQTTRDHSWINIDLKYQSFLLNKPGFHLGLNGRAVLTSQSLFANYTATLLALTEYSPIPDTKTYFLPEYRSPQFIGVGLNAIATIQKNIDIRFDGYYYQPILRVVQTNDGSLVISEPLDGESFMASASIIYHSFLGPIRASVNYLPRQTVPFNFQFSFGYVLFNERAIR